MTCGFLDGTPLCLDTCKSDADCTAASDRTRCDIPNEVCVQCLYDEECQDAMTDCNARCDEATGTCKTLGAPAICPPGRYCNPALLVNASTSTTCVQCQRDGHCTDPKLPFCSLDSFTCVGCTMDSDCKFDYNCDPKCANNKCVEGTTNLNCNSTGMFCDVNAAVCVECVDDHACISKNAAAPFCDAFGKCVACTTHADCRTNSSCDSWCRSDGICQKTAAPLDCTKTGSYCNNNTGKCLQCKKDSDCGSDAPICNTKTNTCIQCITEEHCANNTNCKGACMNGVCLKGSLDCTATKQVCAAVAGTYQCVTYGIPFLNQKKLTLFFSGAALMLIVQTHPSHFATPQFLSPTLNAFNAFSMMTAEPTLTVPPRATKPPTRASHLPRLPSLTATHPRALQRCAIQH